MTLQDWIDKHQFIFRRERVREWGGYELGVSLDNGQTFAIIERPFGSRISERDAFTDIMTDGINDVNIRPQLIQWLGNDRFNELDRIFHPLPPEEVICNQQINTTDISVPLLDSQLETPLEHPLNLSQEETLS